MAVRWVDIPQLSIRDRRCPAAWQQYWQQSRARSRLNRSGLRVEPDGYVRCPGQPDSAGAAGAAASDERSAAIRAQGDHLGVAPVTGRSPVLAPVRGMRLDLVAGGPGGVGGSDRVGSTGTTAVHQQDAPGVPVQDHRQGLLNGAYVVPGTAAGHQEPGTAGACVVTSDTCCSRVRVCPCSDPAPGRLHRAGDGPRPVRAGSGLALGFWPECPQWLRGQARLSVYIDRHPSARVGCPAGTVALEAGGAGTYTQRPSRIRTQPELLHLPVYVGSWTR